MTNTKIGVLTSGGDASCMNKCLSSLVSYAPDYGCEVYFIFNGYKGLYYNQIIKANYTQARLWYDLKGSMIFSSRFPQILEPQINEQMVLNYQKAQLDALVVIGGDGSYQGAALLASKGVKLYCLPGTIDNDVASCTYTIGFDSALNTIVQQIRQIKACMNSHASVGMVEIMGRDCVDLTVFAAIATEADAIITPFNPISPQQLLVLLNQKRQLNKRGMLVLYVEKYLGKNGVPSASEYIAYIHQNSQETVKHNILGYSQRCGDPSAMDLVRASLMVQRIYTLLAQKTYNQIIGNQDLTITNYPLEEGLKMQKNLGKTYVDLFFKN